MIYILDFGYLAFYRYHAAKRYFSFKDGAYDLDDPWQNEPSFRECLLKQIEKMVGKFRGAKRVRVKNTLFFACEALNGSINWRTKIHAAYKGTRTKNEDIYKFMTFLYDEFLPSLCNDETIQILRGNCEADDLIALKCKECDDEEDITIVSSDLDFLQLVESSNNIRLIDAKMNDIAKKKGICGQKYLKEKIVDGDSSDNIPALFHGRHKKQRRNELVEKLNTLDSLDDVTIDTFDGDIDLFEKFKFNRVLIDFNQIQINE